MIKTRISALLRKMPGGGKAVVAVLLAFLVGYMMPGDSGSTGPATQASGTTKDQWYTCSMHPQIRLRDPNGHCPICGMALIPVKGGGDDDAGPRVLKMSEAARILAEVRTSPVERHPVIKEVRLVGKVGYDETRMRTITAWVPGRLDKLYVDYTGVAVQQGAPVVYMYSPELLVAQQALLSADAAYGVMSKTAASKNNLAMQMGTVKALEDRLRLWGLADDQIKEIRKLGIASDHMTIRSPISGIVIQKNNVEGDYVKIGAKIYHIADLSTLWVYLDAYESDLAWIKYAQQVEFEAEAYPGEIFRGRISFIDPFLHEITRTVKVRVTVENLDGRLKPGMFVRARIHAKLALGSRIIEPSLAGKWISPLHPEKIMDEPGNCPICGAPLISAESLGYVGEDAPAPLVIPATAPLRTGLRAVVYVRVPGAERPTFEGREVVLGPRTQQHYIVVSGVKEGELVVSHGAFKIDSALQILAKPSMMSPTEDDGEIKLPVETPESFLRSLSRLYQSSIRLQRALAEDDLARANEAFTEVRDTVESVDMSSLTTGEGHETWMALSTRLIEQARVGAHASDLAGARVVFDEISNAVLETVRRFGQATGVELYEAHCPMAFDGREASWLADEKAILNPYLGSSMPDCGSVEATFASVGEGPKVDAGFRQKLTGFYDTLLATHKALVGDDLAQAKSGAVAAVRALDEVSAKPGVEWMNVLWLEIRGRATQAAEAVAKAEDIEQARAAYGRLNDAALVVLGRFGHARPTPLNEAFCPMAFDNRGASWIQEGNEVANPFYGSQMPGCGEIRRRFQPIIQMTVPPAFLEGVAAVMRSYLDIGEALSRDDFKKAVAAVPAVDDALTAVSPVGLGRKERELWRDGASDLHVAVSQLRKATDLEGARRPFVQMSETLASLLAHLGHAGSEDLVEFHCSMAFSNRGASWIQRGKETRNPYFGASMPRCGDVVRSLPRESKD